MRRFARANGPEIVRATADKPEVLYAIHDLKNWEIRQAAINSGIDVGQKHVGARQALGEAQVGRQDLIRQMLERGVKPEDIPGLARPQTRLDPAAGQQELYSITKNAGYSIPTREIFPNVEGITKKELYDVTNVKGKGWSGASAKSEPHNVEVNKLEGIQATVDADAIHQSLKNIKIGKLTTDLSASKEFGALVVRYKGHDFIVDGNHRLAALKLSGAKTVRVNFLDLDQ